MSKNTEGSTPEATPRGPSLDGPSHVTPLSIRVSTEVLRALDAWIVEENQKERPAPLNRTDLIRGLLAWAARTRPEWEEGHHVLVVHDEYGAVLLRKSVPRVEGGEFRFVDQQGVARVAYFKRVVSAPQQVITIFQTNPTAPPVPEPVAPPLPPLPGVAPSPLLSSTPPVFTGAEPSPPPEEAPPGEPESTPPAAS